jgi:hypothetical protein
VHPHTNTQALTDSTVLPTTKNDCSGADMPASWNARMALAAAALLLRAMNDTTSLLLLLLPCAASL